MSRLILPKQVNLVVWPWRSAALANKGMVASVTLADNDLACATAIAMFPASSQFTTQGGYIAVDVSGLWYVVGNGTKVGVPCYFSANGGTTARALQAVTTGDLLYWNGSVAGHELSASFLVSFHFQVA